MNTDEVPELKRPLLNVPEVPYEEPEEEGDDSYDVKSNNLGQNSRRAYLKELRKVVENADVVLHVLDARDPLGTRSSAIIDMIEGAVNKRLVFVLNKADLVPRDVLVEWLQYLRKFYPTLPFKCNTQIQKGNLGSMSGKIGKQQESALNTNQAVGAEELIGLLKNYARVGETKTIISVGCVGFPNVGKSSLINSLLRTRAVGVSSTPGFTKQIQEVVLDKTIRLIDSPGIVFADGDSAATTLRNCVHVEALVDVISPVQAILELCPATYLMQLYGIPAFADGDATSFLSSIARTTGKLKKGGVPNVTEAAKTVLHDWNEGKIKYYVRPPKSSDDPASRAGAREAVLLSGYSKEFDIAELPEEDLRVLNQIEACVDQGDFSGPFVPVAASEGSVHFGAAETASTGRNAKRAAAAAAADEDMEDAEVGAVPVVKSLSRKALKGGQTDGRNGRGGSVVGSVASLRSTVGGVLSRTTPEEPPAEEDPRKALKAQKKKSLKNLRRQSKDSAGGVSEEGFDFDVLA